MKKTTSKHILLGIAFWAVSVGMLSAQILHDGELLLHPVEIMNQYLTGPGNQAYIQQIGSFNEVELLQINQNGNNGNFASLLQNGHWNIALITQSGERNKLALVQHGNQNVLELINTGYENELITIQDGNGNKIMQHLIDSHQVQAELIQVGNQNEIISTLEGIHQSNYSVRQTGDGMKVIINKSSF
jgi:hypothetical protein